MLRLLVDEQISPRVASEVQRHVPECDIVSLHVWQDGAYMGAEDALVLDAASADARTLLTRDIRTILPLLTERAREGRSHAGVIFVDDRTIPEGNVGVLVR